MLKCAGAPLTPGVNRRWTTVLYSKYDGVSLKSPALAADSALRSAFFLALAAASSARVAAVAALTAFSWRLAALAVSLPAEASAAVVAAVAAFLCAAVARTAAAAAFAAASVASDAGVDGALTNAVAFCCSSSKRRLLVLCPSVNVGMSKKGHAMSKKACEKRAHPSPARSTNNQRAYRP